MFGFGDVPGVLWRSTHEQGRFPFLRLRSFYPATFGQAIPSAFGHLAMAETPSREKPVPFVSAGREAIETNGTGVAKKCGRRQNVVGEGTESGAWNRRKVRSR